MVQDQLQQLFELNQVDVQIDGIRKKISEVPGRKDQIGQTVRELEAKIGASREKIASLEKERGGLETEIQVLRERLEEFQKKVNSIKTNREYQAALKEIAETKEMQRQMEEKLLGVMTQLEALNKELQSDESLYQTEKAKGEEEMNLFAKQETEVQTETAAFEEQRKKIRGLLGAALLAQYDRIRLARPDVVAEVVGGTCQGCHMRIPPQLSIEIQKLHAVHSCPSCRRFLFVARKTA